VSNSIVLGCWIVFSVYWVVSSLTVKRTAERQSIFSMLVHRIPIGFSGFLLVYQHWPPPMNRVLIPRAGWVLVTGATICAGGMFVALWARWTLAGNWSSNVTFKRGHELVTSGPYRFVRHPIYSGLLVMFIGTALEIGRLHCWLAVPLAAVGCWIKLRQEEALLLRHFPEAYPTYFRQVKALVPYVI
jgi:protein-S-isoprenylcysteine O-methyltransferase Ste14